MARGLAIASDGSFEINGSAYLIPREFSARLEALSKEARGSALEIMGMGQAIAPLSLTARRGDPRRAQSIRRAVVRACRDAAVDLRWLLECDFALLHDAFVSIELSFLRELELVTGRVAWVDLNLRERRWILGVEEVVGVRLVEALAQVGHVV